ncbi:MAG: hypothetical protein WCJ19_03660 [bacterium]
MKLFFLQHKKKKAFSTIEIIFAISIFSLVVLSLVSSILFGVQTSTSTGIKSRAISIADEGLQAVKNIRDNNWDSIVNGTYGLAISGNQWILSGTSDITGIFTRNIVISTIDSNTKKITSTVTWPQGSSTASVSSSTYLSNWTATTVDNSIPLGGILAYGNNSTDVINYKLLDSTTGEWGTQQAAADVSTSSTNRVVRYLKAYSATTRNEYMIVTKHFDDTTQYIYAQSFNGSTWTTPLLLSSWNSTSMVQTEEFDGGYLSNGNFMVVYSDNSNTPKFRIWNGSSWTTSASTYDVGGNPTYIVLKVRPGTNEVMVAVFDQQKDTNTMYYSDTAWSSLVQHASNAPANSNRLVDFAWSPNNITKGALIYSTSGSDNTIETKIWTANGTGGGTWSSEYSTSALADKTSSFVVKGSKGVNEFQVCSKDGGTNPQIKCYKITFTPSWTNPTNQVLTTTSYAAAQRPFALGWESQSGSNAISVYSNNSSTPQYKIYNPTTSTWDSTASTLPNLNGTLTTAILKENPINDDIMILMGNAVNNVYTVAWDGTNHNIYSTPTGYSLTNHSLNGISGDYLFYDFAWNEYIPVAATHIQSTISYSTATVASRTATMPSSVTVGNTLIVGISSWYGSGGGCALPAGRVTDNKGNTYTKVVESSVTNETVSIWYTTVTTGGTNFIITVNSPTGKNCFLTLAPHEYSGLLTTNVVDQSAGATGTSTTASTANTPTTTNAKNLIFGAFLHQSASTINVTVGSTFTLRQSMVNGAYEPLVTEDKIVNTTGNYYADVVWASSIGWNGVVAAFKSQ